MALIKQKSIKGYPAEYWRITQLNSNFDKKDAVITLSLYKDETTRLSDPNAVVDSFQVDLGEEFSNAIYNNRADTVKNIKLKNAYKLFKDKAIAESEKEEKDESLAWFADVEDSI